MRRPGGPVGFGDFKALGLSSNRSLLSALRSGFTLHGLGRLACGELLEGVLLYDNFGENAKQNARSFFDLAWVYTGKKCEICIYYIDQKFQALFKCEICIYYIDQKFQAFQCPRPGNHLYEHTISIINISYSNY
jgi:hypothetical protein